FSLEKKYQKISANDKVAQRYNSQYAARQLLHEAIENTLNKRIANETFQVFNVGDSLTAEEGSRIITCVVSTLYDYVEHDPKQSKTILRKIHNSLSMEHFKVVRSLYLPDVYKNSV